MYAPKPCASGASTAFITPYSLDFLVPKIRLLLDKVLKVNHVKGNSKSA